MTMPRITFSDRVEAALNFRRRDLPQSSTMFDAWGVPAANKDADPQKVFLDRLENVWKRD